MLDEIAMNPSSLKSAVENISGALAGMEFEMYVPDTNDGDSSGLDYDSDPEPDYDQDERVYSFDAIEEFFYDGDHNSRRTVQSAIDSLREEYNGWLFDQYKEDGREWFEEWVRNRGDFDFDDAISTAEEELADQEEKLSPEEKEKFVDSRVAELFSEYIDYEFDRNTGAWDVWREDNIDDYDEHAFLIAQGYRRMSDLPGNFNLTWPHWTYPEFGGSRSIQDIADDFSNAIGREVNWSDRYHGSKREQGKYSLEPDGSLSDKDESTDAGLEFISPPLSISEMISDLQKVKKWAKSERCYTNESTGLHMNISIPGFSLQNMDFVKLAILLGDNYILEQFGRESNTYCLSAFNKVKTVLSMTPERVPDLLNSMRGKLNGIAANILRPTLNKYMSVNPQSGKTGEYIEFRSPGGDWLSEDTNKLINTMLRFVVVMDAAMDPEKYRQEYLKKLYKLLTPSSSPDIVQLFSNYSAGLLPKDALVRQVRNMQTTRDIERGKVDPNQRWHWNVTYENAEIEVVAKNEVEAKSIARSEWGLPASRVPDAHLKATREEPYKG